MELLNKIIYGLLSLIFYGLILIGMVASTMFFMYIFSSVITLFISIFYPNIGIKNIHVFTVLTIFIFYFGLFKPNK